MKKRRTCKVDGCDGVYHALGYCIKHHQRFKKYGDPKICKPVGRPAGLKLSQRTKGQTSNTMKGHKHSEETKRKISEGLKRYHRSGLRALKRSVRQVRKNLWLEREDETQSDTKDDTEIEALEKSIRQIRKGT